MPENSSASVTPLVSPDSVRDLVQGVLRAAKVAGWTDEALEGQSGVCARRIKSYRVEGKEPSLSAALSLAAVLGTKALNPILAKIGYVARPLDEADEISPGAVVAGVATNLATIARAASDGRIDHVEQPDCQEAADQIIATVLPLSSAGKAS